VRKYLPQVNIKAHTTILSTTSRTTLTQQFIVPTKRGIKKLRYTFPLYDGVSVVGFQCRVKNRVITGEVKEKEQARAEYKEAVEKGEVAGLLEQLPDASDVFTTTIGNVPPNCTVDVEITYLGELKHDAEVDGLRFTIPTSISPRYGNYPGELLAADPSFGTIDGKFEVTVDAQLEEGMAIRKMISPSHPVSISMGTLSTNPEGDPALNQSSATLALGTSQLDRDFVLQVVSKEVGTPKALLEDHPRIPGQRALMATLVPKFELQTQRPELVFVCDRSGSMGGEKINALKRALAVFLKSLPVGVVFNICSFGSHHDYLWKKSMPYTQTNMDAAMKYVQKIDANYGGTSMLAPMKDTIERRFEDRNLEIFLVTDGEIWDQQSLFDLLNQKIKQSRDPIRVFTLGVGDAVSHALIEGVARRGNGFCQSVGENEKLDGKVVRMLKGALFPHITDYSLEVKYAAEKSDDDEFEIIDKVNDCLEIPASSFQPPVKKGSVTRKVISLFDANAKPDADIKKDDTQSTPRVPAPKLLQAPHEIPPLFPFNRTTVYLLLSPEVTGIPTSVVLNGTSPEGPVQLEIPVQHLAQPGETIHQLAAKKAMQELEEGHGWIHSAKVNGKLVKVKYPSRIEEVVRAESVRLGVQFQVAGKDCSFIAVEKKDADAMDDDSPPDYEFLDEEIDKLNLADEGYGGWDVGGGSANVQLSKGISHARSRRSVVGRMASAVSAPLSSGLRSMPKPSAAPGSAPRSLGAPMMLDRAANGMSMMSAAPLAPGAFGGDYCASIPPPPPPAAPEMEVQSRRKMQNRAVVQALGKKGKKDKKKKKMSTNFLTFESVTTECCLTDESSEDGIGGAPRFLQSGGGDESADEEMEGGFEASAHGKTDQGSDVLYQLIAMQTFEGSWKWDDKFLALLKLDLKKAVAQSPKVDRQCLATALAIRYLETKLEDQKDSWELLVEKARDWLGQQLQASDKENMFGMADKILA
jgi:vault protein inter-alpha-trypsin-like protein/VWA domain-containing protein